MSAEKQIAIITGATRGIGKAIALELGRRGMTVVGTATRPAGAQAIATYLEEAGIPGEGRVLDVTQRASVEEFVKVISATVGQPTVLVNNAGITRDNLMIRLKDEDWDAVLDTNLSAVFRLTRACLKGMMKARRGRIINIASVVGVMGNAGQANYAAAKAGMLGFTKSLARELGSRGITVNAVAPGFIDTDMTHGLPEAQRKQLLDQIPLGRLGDAADVAGAVGFLTSPAAGYITGETLHVNGGMYMV